MTGTTSKTDKGIEADRVEDVSQAAITRLVFTNAREMAERVHIPLIQLALDRAAPAVAEIAKAQGELGQTMVRLSRTHVEDTVSTLRALAETRDLHDAAATVSRYAVAAIGRANEMLSRQLELAAMASRALTINGHDGKAAPQVERRAG